MDDLWTNADYAWRWKEKRYQRYILIIDRRNPDHVDHEIMKDDAKKPKTWNDRLYLVKVKKARGGEIDKHYA